MEIRISLSQDRPYSELCSLDGKIRELQQDQVEALPAVIFYLDDLLAPMLLRRTELKQRLGFKDVTGPFYSDRYFHNRQAVPIYWPEL